MEKKSLKKNWLIIVLIIIAVGSFILGKALKPKSLVVTDPTALPGMQVTLAPWPAEITNLRERLSVIKLPALSVEGSALHIHQHLDIFIHGESAAVPSEIGVDERAGFISPIHTHDTSSTIHIESPTVQQFTLGQFFDVWGVRFSEQAIGGYASDDQNSLKVFVNGKEFVGDPRSLILTEKQEIVVTFGTAKELPDPVPSAYTFNEGL